MGGDQWVRSSGLRFSHLEDLEDVIGQDRAAEGEAGRHCAAHDASESMNVASGAVNVKVAAAAVPAIDVGVKVVLKASNLSLLAGLRQVQRAEMALVGNPSGLGITLRMKKKALRDVTNKLESGPMTFRVPLS